MATLNQKINEIEGKIVDLQRQLNKLRLKADNKYYLNTVYHNPEFNNLYCFVVDSGKVGIYNITHQTFWKGRHWLSIKEDAKGKYITLDDISTLTNQLTQFSKLKPYK